MKSLDFGRRVGGDFHAHANFDDHRGGPGHCISSVWNSVGCILLLECPRLLGPGDGGRFELGESIIMFTPAVQLAGRAQRAENTEGRARTPAVCVSVMGRLRRPCVSTWAVTAARHRAPLERPTAALPEAHQTKKPLSFPPAAGIARATTGPRGARPRGKPTTAKRHEAGSG